MKVAEHFKREEQSGPATNRPAWENFKISQPLVIALLLFGLTCVLYWPACQFDFLSYDDPMYVTGNPRVLAGLSLNNVAWAFLTNDAANWHPLTWLSLMLDIDLFGKNPHGVHLVNVLLNAANSVLVFWLMRRWTKKLWPSAIVAALFAVHPLHVESVAWISERKDLLCAFFTLLTLLAYSRWAAPPPGQKPAKLAYLMSLLWFAAALMSKPMAVTLPFVLLLLDIWPLHRFSLESFRPSA